MNRQNCLLFTRVEGGVAFQTKAMSSDETVMAEDVNMKKSKKRENDENRKKSIEIARIRPH